MTSRSEALLRTVNEFMMVGVWYPLRQLAIETRYNGKQCTRMEIASFLRGYVRMGLIEKSHTIIESTNLRRTYYRKIPKKEKGQT